ncbi:MAG: hypothetical protein HW399_347, partial [Dehalococcoidia bacterium]|nr:hypothetical protein [Dehalococcoidia bacterium]
SNTAAAEWVKYQTTFGAEMPDVFANYIRGLLGVIGVQFVMPCLSLKRGEGFADWFNNFS